MNRSLHFEAVALYTSLQKVQDELQSYIKWKNIPNLQHQKNPKYLKNLNRDRKKIHNCHQDLLKIINVAIIKVCLDISP